MNICNVGDCESKVKGWGFCNKHYQRWKKHGNPMFVKNIYPERTKNEEDKFDAMVHYEPMTGCWLWAGANNGIGYGVMHSSDGRMVYVHRWSYERHVGPIDGGMFVCHKCDTPACVNPEHLFLGDYSDNSEDMVNKGRSTKGSKNPMAKLTEEDISVIRSSPLMNKEVAVVFGVKASHVSRIRNNHVWRHVEKEMTGG